jgi:amino acid transporter
MASTGVDVEGSRRSGSIKETRENATEKGILGDQSSENASVGSVVGDNTHRTLKSRHIQLIGSSRDPTGP